MRLVTRCPACATTFKVVRDQLRISDGWVRCGRCSEVFDATQDLHETDEDGTPLRAAGVETGETSPHVPASRPPQENLLPPSAPASPLPAMNWPAADLLDLGAKAKAPAPLPDKSAVPETDAEFDDPVPIPSIDDDDDKEPWFDEMMASTQALQEALQSASASKGEFGPSPSDDRKEPGFSPALTTPSLMAPSPIEQAVNAQLQKALRRERIKVLRNERAQQKARERAEQSGPTSETSGKADIGPTLQAPDSADAMATTLILDAPSEPVSFMEGEAVAPAKPRSRIRRVLLALCCLLALVVLLLQVAREERDTLVAREPRLRPALQALCQWTDCQLSALKQIGSITIEGASFSREKDNDGYRLVFTLRNGSRMPLAMPSIELTLLDTQQRALVRRVLSPSQFGAGPVLGPGAESNLSLPVQLAGNEAAGLAPVAGYNLVAFYP